MIGTTQRIRKRILVVEDDPAIRRLYGSLLSNYSITMAKCSSEAINLIDLGSKFDLLLLDINLPDGSGLDFLRRIQDEKKIWIPTIISSGYPSQAKVTTSRELGAVCFIDKPASNQTIKNAVKAILRESEDEEFSIDRESSFAYIQSAPDGTHKFVTFDQYPLEFAVIKDDVKRHTICLSSQYGCAQGCNFCVTGSVLNKNVRNVTCEELESKLEIARMYYGGFRGKKVRILFAGEGEPSRNLWNVVRFMEKKGVKYEYRLSTVGLVDTLPKLTAALAHIPTFDQLQISLHAPNDSLREKIMRSAHRNSIREILLLGEDFYEKTGKVIALNYVLFNGINDSSQHIKELINLLKGRSAFFVRLSKANPFGIFQPVSEHKTRQIGKMLNDAGIKKKVFESHGPGTSSPCGQMAARINGEVRYG